MAVPNLAYKKKGGSVVEGTKIKVIHVGKLLLLQLPLRSKNHIKTKLT